MSTLNLLALIVVDKLKAADHRYVISHNSNDNTEYITIKCPYDGPVPESIKSKADELRCGCFYSYPSSIYYSAPAYKRASSILFLNDHAYVATGAVYRDSAYPVTDLGPGDGQKAYYYDVEFMDKLMALVARVKAPLSLTTTASTTRHSVV